MQKIILVIIITLLPSSSLFGAVKIDGLCYNFNNNTNTASVTSGSEHQGAVSIPASVTYNGKEYKVTEIGVDAFYGCKDLTSVTFPNTLEYISVKAFMNCTGLTTVTIPGNVKNIGTYSFCNCTGLTSVFIEEGVQIIENLAFQDCTGLVTFTIPNSVTRICNRAFNGCRFSSLTIGSGVVTIEPQNDVEFYNGQLVGFSEIKIWGDGSRYVGALPLKTIWLTNTPPAGYKYLEGEVNYVSNNLYENLENKVVYPFLSTMFEVGGVKYVPISPSERTCDAFDCSYDKAIENIVIDKSVSYKGITMSVKKICPYAFCNNPYIKTANLSISGIIGRFAFYGCSSLQGIDIPDEVTDVGVNAFRMCASLKYAKIGNGLKSLRELLFSNCRVLTDIQIGENVSDIYSCVFEDCSALSLIRIPKNVMRIHQYAFQRCTSLKTIVLEDQDTPSFTKRTRCFEDWVGTESNTSHIYNIKVNAGDVLSFDYYNTRNIKIDGYPIDNEEPILDNEPGGDCGMSIKQAQQAIDMKNVTFSFARSFNTTRTVSLEVTGGTGSAIYNIRAGDAPKDVLHIDHADRQATFNRCPLDSVYIGRKILYPTISFLGYSPFYRNTSLRAVEITDKEIEVQLNEFYGCTGLKNVRIGDGVTRIDNWAFSDCSNLDYFEFGSSVDSIGVEAFSDCVKVTQLISHATVPPICGSQALDDISKWICTLKVPNGSVASYQAAPQWKEFFFIEAGINEVKNTIRKNEEYYTIDGRKMELKPTKKGIYIVNGQKVVLK